MGKRETRREALTRVAQTLPPFKRGLMELHRAQAREERRQSPKGRAGRIGGLVAARTFPASQRPRGANGRFVPQHGRKGRTTFGKEGQSTGDAPPVLNSPAARSAMTQARRRTR